jgi:hypothetical protein
MLSWVCRLAVSEVRLALPNFYNMTIRLADAFVANALLLWQLFVKFCVDIHDRCGGGRPRHLFRQIVPVGNVPIGLDLTGLPNPANLS